MIFYNWRSKVKVTYPQKCAISGPILVTEVRYVVIRDQRGLGGVPLAACQLFLASCQMLWENGGFPLEQFGSIGSVPVWLAKCQIWKRSQAEISRDSAMRGVPLHVYYIHFSQYTHPMGSDRPPLAAGESIIGIFCSVRVRIPLVIRTHRTLISSMSYASMLLTVWICKQVRLWICHLVLGNYKQMFCLINVQVCYC